jgi:hypothetical protein
VTVSRHDPRAHVAPRTWRFAQLSLIVVLSATALAAFWIIRRGDEVRAALILDRFDEHWQIRSGVAQSDRLMLHPMAESIGVALRPLAAAPDGFTLQTRATFNQATGVAGLIVQADDADHFTAFLISADGYFRLSDYRNGAWIDREPWRAWPHIRRDASPNVLRAECHGEICTFFVNDEWTWQAASLPATRQVGVVATGLDAPSGGNVVFDQFALPAP